MLPAPFSIGDVTKGAVAAVAFLLSFAPGFVAMKTYDWFAEAEPRKVQDLLYEIIGYSSVTYAIASPLLAAALLFYMQTKMLWHHYAIVAVTAIVCILLLPFALGFAVAALQKRAEQQNSTFIGSIKMPWDYAFRNRKNSLVTVVLNDGTKVTGLPGSASNYPYAHELFISQLWKTDHRGTPLEPNAESRGMLIFASQIKAIIFLEKPATA